VFYELIYDLIHDSTFNKKKICTVSIRIFAEKCTEDLRGLALHL